jgi:hypothetical protein
MPIILSKEVDRPVDLFSYQGITCSPDGSAKISDYDEKRFQIRPGNYSLFPESRGG